jgi:para-nitrobenzyl esterase
MLNFAEIEELNKQNQPITGTYNKKYAVKTKTGIFVGYKENKIMAYSGIPYAKPPVGNLRWKAPEPLPESDEVFEAKYFGASAIQVEYDGSILKHHRQSEDCLTLNIAFKDLNKDKKKPVLVLFHHGDFSYGGSADPLMYGENLTSTYSDFVGVSFNYRLGIFGFIDFSDVPGGKDYPDALNLGLLDQIAALKWIKENISEFGGDPNNITVIGFEAGAISISLLAACEKAKGLFQKAFIFFGSPENAYNTPESSRKLAEALLKETSTTTMEELQKLSTERLKEAAQKLWINAAATTCDGKLIPKDTFKNYHKLASKDIEFVVGIPHNETQIYKSFVGQQIYEYLVTKRVEEILSCLDKSTAQAVQNYIKNHSANITEFEAKAKLCEQWYALCMYVSAMQLSKAGNKVRLMYWNVKPLIENLGAGTVAVALAFFGNNTASQMYGNVLDSNISKIFQAFMKKFMKGELM